MGDDAGAPVTVADGGLSIREPPRVLVPVEVLNGQTIPQSLVEFLAPAEVVVLGYHVLPEQTPTEQASMQFEDRARAAVDDIAAVFAAADREVETRVVFTHDREKTVDRVAAEIGATAVLLPNPVGEITEVFVPIRGTIDADRLADLVATMVDGSGGRVTLWTPTGGPTVKERVRLLDEAADTLYDRGLSDEQVRTDVSDGEPTIHGIVTRSAEFDIIVTGEGERSLLTAVLGDTTERIAEGAVAPILVVRGRDDSET